MTTAFVLSGGGSLGAVQVGMLQALARRGVQPDLLVGTSAGAVNAVWVAQHGMSPGSLTQLGAIWEGLRRRDIFPLRATNVLGGFLGRDSAISSSAQLGELVRSHSSIDELSEAAIPVHVLATDLLSGQGVLLSSGSPSDTVRASAAIPGIYPPVQLGDRWYIDGALGTPAGVTHAARLGATEIYVLPAGVPCTLTDVPHSALGVAVHALSLLIQQRLSADLVNPPAGATIRLLPPLCPMTVSVADFTQAGELIDRSRHASITWLEDNGTDLPHPARFLSLHTHDQAAWDG